MTFAEWIRAGIDNGWCAAPLCDVHDAWVRTDEEQEQIEDGNDVCIYVVRLYGDPTVTTDLGNNLPCAY